MADEAENIALQDRKVINRLIDDMTLFDDDLMSFPPE